MKGTEKQLEYVAGIRDVLLEKFKTFDLENAMALDKEDKEDMKFYYDKWVYCLNNLDKYFTNAKDFIEMFKFIYKKCTVWDILHYAISEELFGMRDN